MVTAIITVSIIWLLVMLTIQSIRFSSGKKMIPVLKLLGLGLIGVVVTAIIVMTYVTIF